MSTFFLNELSRLERQLRTPDPGRWMPDDQFLEKFPHDIHLEAQVADKGLINSIPSAFARPIQFFRALESERHPLHLAVRSQWRGLMALFGLNDLAFYRLKAEVFRLDERLKSATGRNGADLPLLEILQNQAPMGSADPEDWSRWYLIYCDGALVGATSPWSFVYTPVRYRCPNSIRWQREGLLTDPIEIYRNSLEGSEELGALSSWVGRLLKQGGWHLRNQAHENVLRRHLELWSQDLVAARPVKEVAIEGKEQYSIREEPWRTVLSSPKFRLEIESPELLLTAPDGTEFILLTTNLDPAIRVVDRVLASQVDLEQVKRKNGEPGWRTSTGQTIKYPAVIAEDTFFTQKLLRLGDDQDVQCLSVASPQGKDWSFALPVTMSFFQHFGVDAFHSEKAAIEMHEGPGRIVIELRLTLPSGRIVVAAKSYHSSKDVLFWPESGPAVGLWPNFVSKSWNEYYAAATFPAELDGAEVSLGLEVAPLADNGAVFEWHSGNSLRPQEDTVLWSARRPLLGFAFRDPTGSELGFALRMRLELPASRKSTQWKVAIDFGTSSTHVMFREGNSEPRKFSYSRRISLLTRGKAGLEIPLQLNMCATSLSPAAIEAPVITLLRQRSAHIVEDQEGPLLLVESSPVFEFYPLMANKFHPNVKWARVSKGAAQSSPMRDYLRGLLRAILAEAHAAGVSEVSIEWSFPLALPKASRTAMSSFWMAEAATGAICDFPVVEMAKGTSESEALSRYLSARDSRKTALLGDGLFVALDVGGGSSDMAFWSGGDLLGQDSFKLAANDIFGPLAARKMLLDVLAKACQGKVTPGAYAEISSEERGALVCNALLTKAAEDLMTKRPSDHPVVRGLATFELDRREAPWRNILGAAYALFAGLAYYLGMEAWRHHAELKSIEVYFGGRGCSLLAWFGPGTEAIISKTLKEFFCDGWNQAGTQAERLGEPPKGPRLVPEKITFLCPALGEVAQARLKEETVLGLLMEKFLIEKTIEGGLAEGAVAGEVGWMFEDGSELDWRRKLQGNEFSKLKQPRSSEALFISHFARKLASHEVVDELQIALPRLNSTGASLNRVQHLLRQEWQMEGEVLQPLFAFELKEIVEQFLE